MNTTKSIYSRYISLSRELIRFKSISTDPAYSSEMVATATWLHDLFTSEGFSSEMITGYGNPLVVARLTVDPAFKMILIYGHYDVQPASEEEGWESDPFTLTERSGRLYARGSIDNKGQFMIHVATVLELAKVGKLKTNVVFFLEGNEETGSAGIDKFVKAFPAKLTSDYIMISDGEIVSDLPVIEVGFRGVVNAELRIRTLKTDLHSGLYGGAIPSAAHEMCKVLAGLHSDQGYSTVSVPGFYDGVVPPTQAQLKNNAGIPFSRAEFEENTGSKTLFNESDYDIYTQTGLRPSLEVTGVTSGYTGVGYRNSVPGTAVAKFNIRLVNGQNIEAVQAAFKSYFERALPEYAQWELIFDESAPPVFLDISDPIFKSISGILTDVAGKDVIYKYVGGSIPIVNTFQEVLRVPQLLVPLANEDCNMHGANENFTVELAKRGIEFSARVFG